jgi:hypothetical protein
MTTENIEPATPIVIPSKRSDEYTKILIELRNWRVGARDIAKRLYEQGKRDGLSNELIRNDIDTALNGVVTPRQLTRSLPDELKRSGGYKPRKDIMSFQKTAAQAAMEFKNQPATTQLATDSISKTMTVENSNADIEHEPDQSEVYELPQNYEIENVPIYDRSYLIKIVEYLHNEVSYLNNKIADTIPSPVDDRIIVDQLQQKNEELSKKNINLILAITKLEKQLEEAGLVPVARISMTTTPTSTAAEA